MSKEKHKKTVIEAILVIIIVVVLFFVFFVHSHGSKSKEAAAQAQVSTLVIALTNFAAHCKTFSADLKPLTVDPGIKGWKGPYLQKEIDADPWGTPYRYRIIDNKPVVDSAGPDGKFDTEDDIKGEEG